MTYSFVAELLGLRPRADRSDRELDEIQFKLDAFKTAAKDCIGSDAQSLRIALTPTHVFGEAEALTSVLDYLGALRAEMFRKAGFLRGVVGKGALGLLENNGKAKKDRRRSSRIRDISLTPEATLLQVRCEQFKAIGFNLSDIRNENERVVETVWFGGRTNQAIPGADLAMHASAMVGAVTFNRVYEAFDHARVAEPRFSRFFIPFLVTWVRSPDTKDDGGWKEWLRQAASGEFGRRFRSIPGWEFVFFAAMIRLAEIKSTAEDEDLEKYYEAGLKSLTRNGLEMMLHDLPPWFIEGRARQRLEDAVREYHRARRGDPELILRDIVLDIRKTKDLLRKHDSDHALSALLKALNEDKIKHHGRAVTLSELRLFCQEQYVALSLDELDLMSFNKLQALLSEDAKQPAKKLAAALHRFGLGRYDAGTLHAFTVEEVEEMKKRIKK